MVIRVFFHFDYKNPNSTYWFVKTKMSWVIIFIFMIVIERKATTQIRCQERFSISGSMSGESRSIN